MKNIESDQAIDETEELFPELPEKLTRDQLLKITGGVITHLKPKAIGGRFRDWDLEKMRDAKCRLLIEACKTHAAILRDEQLDEHEKRIQELEMKLK